MTNELAVKNTSSLMPALTMDEAAHRYNMVVEYTKKLMTEGKDYGVIPGTGTKPTLLKPGAEKLCSLFGLFPDFETLKEIEDFDKGLFFYREKCTLYRNGEPIASGVGSCNSKEKKYRYRNVYESKASDEEKAKAVSVETRTGKYGPYKVYKIENPEPFELVNTIDKMAQKRALVAATLIATNASEFFTQDIEDMDFVEGTFSDVDETEQPKRKPAPKPEQVDDAIKDAGPEAVDEPMTIERAAKITDSKGTPYIEIDSETLSKKTIGISKGLSKPDLTDEKRQFYQEKLDAIKVILQARESGEI